MKNSKEYAGKLPKFYRSLKKSKRSKIKKISYGEAVEAIVRGIVLEKMSESATKTAFKKFSDYFVDFNDMRVSRSDEIVEMLGEDNKITREVAFIINQVLNSIFRKYNCISMDVLNKMGKRQAKQLLDKLLDSSQFVVDYCMLTFIGGHVIPLTNNMIKFLQDNELVYPDSDYQEIEGFLSRQISANNGYEFYSLLRSQSESRRSSKKKTRSKKTKSKKVKKKTKKKTTAK